MCKLSEHLLPLLLLGLVVRIGTVAPTKAALVVHNLQLVPLYVQRLQVLVKEVDACQKTLLQKEHQPLPGKLAIPLRDNVCSLEYAFL